MKPKSTQQHKARFALRPATLFAFGLFTSGGAGPALAQSATDLFTKTENSLGVSLTNYKYKEPNVMQLKAAKAGFDYAGTYAFSSVWPNTDQGWFFRGEARYATGKADYSSSGTGNIDNAKDWYYEVQGLLGRDFSMGAYVLSPYAGLGYRHLYNDLRGFSSTGNPGYLRKNTLQTAVLGITHKMNMAGGDQLHTSLEYRHLIKGKQTVSEHTNRANPDLSLDQNKGYGLRLSSSWRSGPWSVGPTFTYWNIDRSETVTAGGRSWIEPKNTTLEAGFRGAYHF